MKLSLLGRLNLFPQVLVLPLKVRRPQGDLVLLESLRLPAPTGRLPVLQTPLPVLLVLVLLRHGQHLSLPEKIVLFYSGLEIENLEFT